MISINWKKTGQWSKTNEWVFHIAYWVIWVVFWGLMWGTFDHNYTKTFSIQLLELPFKMILVYISLYYLLPQFFLKRSYGKFVLYYLLLLFGLGLTLRVVWYELLEPIYFPDRVAYGAFKFTEILNVIVTLNTAAVVPFGFKLSQLWIAYQQRALTLNNEKLQTELRYLKNQINPHFLFNTLNSLFALSKKQQKDTPEAIMRLSGMMRYMLYDSNERFVPLENELAYLEDYISLEKLRHQQEVDISFAVFGSPSGKIAPLILLPFIENAFKHCKGYQDLPWVSVHISIKDEQLEMNVENSFQPFDRNSQEPSGVGLANVKKRLHLLYSPTAYTLKVSAQPDHYRVFVTIPLQGIEKRML